MAGRLNSQRYLHQKKEALLDYKTLTKAPENKVCQKVEKAQKVIKPQQFFVMKIKRVIIRPESSSHWLKMLNVGHMPRNKRAMSN